MEKILIIQSVDSFKKSPGDYGSYDGYEIITEKQTIRLGIENDQCCCENWGYLITEDDVSEFIGHDFLGLEITDTLLNSKEVPDIYEGDSMFVNIKTSNGLLQFVAYNEHNGYYGHEAVVISRDFNHSQVL